MTPQELWEKYADRAKDPFNGMMPKEQFLAALYEYGAAIRKRDAEICRKLDKIQTQMLVGGKYIWDSDCAAAIEREPLP